MRPALALAGKELVMSIWKDLLLLGGYVATPVGLATVASETTLSEDAAPPAPVEPPARMRARIVAAPRSRPIPPANKISPNDLW